MMAAKRNGVIRDRSNHVTQTGDAMKTKTCSSIPERFGRWLGRGWRGYVRREQAMVGWLTGRCVPVKLARMLPWIFRIVIGALLLYLTFWLTLVLLGVAVLAHTSSDTDTEQDDDWPIGEQADHKKNPGYHPTLYNDAPDSRYYDSRYDD